eukprot:Ihof_evm7s290 gene=Ihof_evmTU7s290
MLGYFNEVVERHQAVSTLVSNNVNNLPKMNDRCMFGTDKLEVFWRALKGDETLHNISRVFKPLPLYKKNIMMKEFSDRNIPAERATWYVKMSILTEQNNAQKPRSMRLDVVAEWTQTLNMYLRELLASMENRKTGSEAPAIIMMRWHYGLRLLHYQYDEGIVSRDMVLEFLLNTFKDGSWIISTLVCGVLQQYLYDYVTSNIMLRKLLLVALEKLAKLLKMGTNGDGPRIVSSQSYGNFTLYCSLCTIIQACVLEGSEALVCPAIRQPNLPSQASHPISKIIFRDMLTATTLSPNLPPQLQQLLEDLVMGEEEASRLRTEALHSPPGGSANHQYSRQTNSSPSPLLEALDSFPALEPMTHTDRKPQLGYKTLEALFQSVFNGIVVSKSSTDQQSTDASRMSYIIPEQESRLENVVWLLLEWATTVQRHGTYRVTVVAGLISILHHSTTWLGDARQLPTVHNLLVSYLDKYIPSEGLSRVEQEEELCQLALLYGELMVHDLFSYTHYVRLLVGRGDMGHATREPANVTFDTWLEALRTGNVDAAYHKAVILLQHLPVKAPYNSHIRNQRRVMLYGIAPNSDEREVQRLQEPIQSLISHINSVSNLVTQPLAWVSPKRTRDLQQIYHTRMVQAVEGRPFIVPLPNQITEQVAVTLGCKFNVVRLAGCRGNYMTVEAVNRRIQLETAIKALPRIYQLDIVAWLMVCVTSYTIEIPVSSTQSDTDTNSATNNMTVTLMTQQQLGEIERIFEMVQAWEARMELLGWVLDHTIDSGLAEVCVHALYRHWEALLVSMDTMQAVVSKLLIVLEGKNYTTGPERAIAFFIEHIISVVGETVVKAPYLEQARELCTGISQFSRHMSLPVPVVSEQDQTAAFINLVHTFPRSPNRADLKGLIENPEKYDIQGFIQALFKKVESFDVLRATPSDLQSLLSWVDICGDINNKVFLSGIITRLLKPSTGSMEKASRENTGMGTSVFIILLCARHCVVMEDIVSQVVIPALDLSMANSSHSLSSERVNVVITLLQWLVLDPLHNGRNMPLVRIFSQIIPAHHRLALAASARVIGLDTLVPALFRLCALKRLMIGTPSAQQAQMAVEDIATTGWVRVRCLQDIDQLYTVYFQASNSNNELTVGDCRSLVMLLSHGTTDGLERGDMSGKGDESLVKRQVEPLFRNLNRWTLRTAKLELQLLTDEWAADKALSASEVDIEKVIVKCLFEKLVEESAKTSCVDAVCPLALCLTEKGQQRVVKETVRWLDQEAWWTRSLVKQIQFQSETKSIKIKDEGRLERCMSAFLLLCLQRITDEALLAQLCSSLLAQFQALNQAPPSTCATDNGLVLRLQLTGALIKPLIKGAESQEWLQHLARLLRRKALKTDSCMDPVVRYIMDIL